MSSAQGNRTILTPWIAALPEHRCLARTLITRAAQCLSIHGNHRPRSESKHRSGSFDPEDLRQMGLSEPVRAAIDEAIRLVESLLSQLQSASGGMT